MPDFPEGPSIAGIVPKSSKKGLSERSKSKLGDAQDSFSRGSSSKSSKGSSSKSSRKSSSRHDGKEKRSPSSSLASIGGGDESSNWAVPNFPEGPSIAGIVPKSLKQGLSERSKAKLGDVQGSSRRAPSNKPRSKPSKHSITGKEQSSSSETSSSGESKGNKVAASSFPEGPSIADLIPKSMRKELSKRSKVKKDQVSDGSSSSSTNREGMQLPGVPADTIELQVKQKDHKKKRKKELDNSLRANDEDGFEKVSPSQRAKFSREGKKRDTSSSRYHRTKDEKKSDLRESMTINESWMVDKVAEEEKSLSGPDVESGYLRLRSWEIPETNSVEANPFKKDNDRGNKCVSRQEVSWVPNSRQTDPNNWDPFSYIKQVSLTVRAAISRPDPPEVSQRLMAEVDQMKLVRDRYLSDKKDRADDYSLCSNWAPPSTGEQELYSVLEAQPPILSKPKPTYETTFRHSQTSKIEQELYTLLARKRPILSKIGSTYKMASSSSVASDWAPPDRPRKKSTQRQKKPPEQKDRSTSSEESSPISSTYHSKENANFGLQGIIPGWSSSKVNPTPKEDNQEPFSKSENSSSVESNGKVHERFGLQGLIPGWSSPKTEPILQEECQDFFKMSASPGDIEEGSGKLSEVNEETSPSYSEKSSLGNEELSFGFEKSPSISEKSSENEESSESDTSESSKSSSKNEFSVDLKSVKKSEKREHQIPVVSPPTNRVGASVSEKKIEGYRQDSLNRSNIHQISRDQKKDTFVQPSPTQSQSREEISNPDIEQGIETLSRDEKRDENRFSWKKLGCCIFIGLGLVGAGVAAAILLTDDGSSNKDSPSPTRAPTPSGPPTTIIEGADSFITESLISVGGASALEDPDSPQSQALEWILGNAFLNTYSKPKILQRYVLAALYYSTLGDSWTNNAGWLTDEDDCEWYTAETDTSICNGKGELDEIDLDDNNVGGTIPWIDFAMLSNQLLVVDFLDNSITGSFPSQLGFLTSLIAIDLFANQLSGSIPSEIGLLTALKYYDSDTNFLTGQIPREVSRIKSLETVWLNNNLLTGTIPSELGKMTNLRNLYLRNNLLTGTMPQEICQLGLDNLEVSCDMVECSCCTNSECNPTNDPLMNLLASVSQDGGAALQDENSPQRAALEWLRSPLNNAFLSDERLIQRYALVTFYYATNGEDWKSSFLWLTSADECIWFTSSKSNTICDKDGRIVELDLRENNLLGSLPAEISLLSDTLGE